MDKMSRREAIDRIDALRDTIDPESDDFEAIAPVAGDLWDGYPLTDVARTARLVAMSLSGSNYEAGRTIQAIIAAITE
jgi:hypothetical protein